MPYYNRNDVFPQYKKNRDSRPLANIELYRNGTTWTGIVIPFKAKEIAGEVKTPNARSEKEGEDNIEALARLLADRLGYKVGKVTKMDCWDEGR